MSKNSDLCVHHSLAINLFRYTTLMQICGMIFEIRIKETFYSAFRVRERTVYKEFQSSSSSDKEQVMFSMHEVNHV